MGCRKITRAILHILKILIVYHLRLGDIIRCLPIAKHFNNLGHEVYFECNREYHNLFELVDYCIPLDPNVDHSLFDRIIDLQIWPEKFQDFSQSPLNWFDYVYSLFDEGFDIDRTIHLNNPAIITPPELRQSVLCFPTGYSQSVRIDPKEVITIAHLVAKGRPVICIGKKEHGFFELDSVEYLCAYIRDASEVVTINSSPSILCSAFREEWFHICQPAKEDFYHSKQKRLELKYEI